MATRIVIVGAGMAGLRAAEALRAGGFSGQVAIFGDEAHRPYNRPPLSKSALVDDPEALVDLAFRTRLTSDDALWRVGETVTAADLGAHRLTTASGEHIEYDVLVAAAGVRAIRLNCPGPAGGRSALRSIADAQAVRRRLTPGSRLVVIGAGFIGCELAATARSLGASVEVVALDQFPLQRPLGPDVGAALRRRHEREGVTFHLGRSVHKFVGTTCAKGVELDDGTLIPADLVVEAVGSRCNVEWLEGNGLDLTDGVLADGFLRVAEDAFAIGDIARYPNRLIDEVPRRIEHWQLAADTARAAARAILSNPDGPQGQAFDQLPYFWSDQYDVKIQAYGWPAIADRSVLLHGSLDGACAVGYFAGGRMVGVVVIGLPKEALGYRVQVMEALLA